MGEYGRLCTLCAAGLRVKGCQVRMNHDSGGCVGVGAEAGIHGEKEAGLRKLPRRGSELPLI